MMPGLGCILAIFFVSLTAVSTTSSLLVINELNADNPGADNAEFVELFDGGEGNTSLDEYQLVFFNGNSANDASYLVINLDTRSTNDNGYFVIGTAGVSPPVDLLQSNNFVQNGADAVALYNKSTRSWTKGLAPTRNGLVDAMVYGSSRSADTALVNVLLPGQSQLHEDAQHLDSGDESLSRCQCCQALNSSVFRLAPVTPGAPNDCTVKARVTPTPRSNYSICKSEVLISEINSDSPGLDDNEFIELYDGGRGTVDLSGHVLVLYNGNGDYSYLTVPLTGYKTDTNGYFLLGGESLDPDIVLPANSVQNGPDGIAVYVDSSLSFPDSSSPTTNRIADAVVYGTRDNPDYSLISSLLQTNHQVDEDFSHHPGEESVSRCFSQAQVHPESFVLTHPTPRQANNCTGYPTPIPSTPLTTLTCPVVGRQFLLNRSGGLLINEVITDQELSGDKEFVELYDGGRGNVLLKGYRLYIVGGNTSKLTCVDLSSYSTSQSGYFLIGTSSVIPRPTVTLDAFDIDSGAVALYANQDKCRPFLSVENLVDAVVFGDGPKINTLLGILVPANNSIAYTPSIGYSISRTESTTPLDLLSFSLQLPTPGNSNLNSSNPTSVSPVTSNPTSVSPVTSNPTSVSPVTSTLLINEVNADDPGADDVEFLELYDGGVGNTNLDGFVVVFFNGNSNNDGSYLTIDLGTHKTNSKGYFVIGTSAVTPAVDLVQRAGFLQNGVDGIAVYWASASRFPVRTPPSRSGLIDAIVYSASTYPDDDLVNALLPNQTQAYENPFFISNGDETLSRCQCCQTNDISVYRLGRPTPGDTNDCSLTSPVVPTLRPGFSACQYNVLINEINADSAGAEEDDEFIELYDGGRGSVSLDGLILVLFNGNYGDRSYLTIPLTGYQTDSKGYFLLGAADFGPDIVLPSNSVQNGPDGVALYLDSPQAFTDQTVATSHHIVDAVVYGTNDHPDYSLIIELLPTLYQVNEDWAHHAGEESINRCFSFNQLHPESFQLGRPTPRQRNNCTGQSTPPAVAEFASTRCDVADRSSLTQSSIGILINEVKTGATSYIELYDGGRGNVSLNGMAVYVLGADTMEVRGCLLLSPGDLTSPSGYFLVERNAVKVEAGAVAVYANQDSCRSYASVDGLADAVVFGSGDRTDALLTLLLPDQMTVPFSQMSEYSVSRCECCTPFRRDSYQEATPTPGESNMCQQIGNPETVSGGGLSNGAIAGIVVSVIILAVVLLLLLGLLFYCRRKQRSQSEEVFQYSKKIDDA